MGKKSVKLRRFLKENPNCCFCGGTRRATTVDHIPPRSFFLQRRHPKGLEFPACSSCNNNSSNAEDIARIISTLQGTVFNPAVKKDFEDQADSYFRAMRINSIRLSDSGKMHEGNHLLELDLDSQEAIIVLSTKVVLGIYYNTNGRTPIEKCQR